MQVEILLAGLTDTSGNPLSAGRVYSYAAGTSEPKPLYTDPTLETEATNPVVLDETGRALCFAVGDYKLVIKDANDNTIYTWNGLNFGEGEDGDTSGEVLYIGETTSEGNDLKCDPYPAIEEYVIGKHYVFKATAVNDQRAVTLNISNLGPVNIYNEENEELELGQILSGEYYEVIFFGEYFRIIGTTRNLLNSSKTGSLTFEKDYEVSVTSGRLCAEGDDVYIASYSSDAITINRYSSSTGELLGTASIPSNSSNMRLAVDSNYFYIYYGTSDSIGRIRRYSRSLDTYTEKGFNTLVYYVYDLLVNNGRAYLLGASSSTGISRYIKAEFGASWNVSLSNVSDLKGLGFADNNIYVVAGGSELKGYNADTGAEVSSVTLQTHSSSYNNIIGSYNDRLYIVHSGGTVKKLWVYTPSLDSLKLLLADVNLLAYRVTSSGFVIFQQYSASYPPPQIAKILDDGSLGRMNVVNDGYYAYSDVANNSLYTAYNNLLYKYNGIDSEQEAILPIKNGVGLGTGSRYFGDCYAEGWYVLSDKSIKRGISDYKDDALKQLMQLKTKTFIYKDDTRNKEQLGLVADDVNEVSKYISSDAADGEKLAINIYALTVLLLKGLQELTEKVDGLINQSR